MAHKQVGLGTRCMIRWHIHPNMKAEEGGYVPEEVCILTLHCQGLYLDPALPRPIQVTSLLIWLQPCKR